jgi:hypothetical protein
MTANSNPADNADAAIDAAIPKLTAATEEFWKAHMRDKNGRRVPVNGKAIDDAVEVAVTAEEYLDGERDPAEITPARVLEYLYRHRQDARDALHEDMPVYMARELEALERISAQLDLQRPTTDRGSGGPKSSKSALSDVLWAAAREMRNFLDNSRNGHGTSLRERIRSMTAAMDALRAELES